jgi:hypothetical protein
MHLSSLDLDLTLPWDILTSLGMLAVSIVSKDEHTNCR